MKLKKIVCFGGGGALPEVVLTPLKEYGAEITSITSMTDDGGSTGELRRELGVIAPGDIRRHILAFSDAPQWKKKLWAMRFGSERFEGGHKGHNFGNIFIAGLSKNLKSYEDVLRECCAFMEVGKRYKPLPATLGDVTLCAELANGQIIEGESEIDVPKKHDADIKIKRIFLKPQARAYAPALSSINKADALIFGPGDLYSSVAACLLPSGMKKAVANSRGKKIFVCNSMNKKGETAGFSVADFSREMEKYLGADLDFVLYNDHLYAEELTEKARNEEESLLSQVAFDRDLDNSKFIGAHISKKDAVGLDAKKTSAAIWKLING